MGAREILRVHATLFHPFYVSSASFHKATKWKSHFISLNFSFIRNLLRYRTNFPIAQQSAVLILMHPYDTHYSAFFRSNTVSFAAQYLSAIQTNTLSLYAGNLRFSGNICVRIISRSTLFKLKSLTAFFRAISA